MTTLTLNQMRDRLNASDHGFYGNGARHFRARIKSGKLEVGQFPVDSDLDILWIVVKTGDVFSDGNGRTLLEVR